MVAKKKVQDIVPGARRSIRSVSLKRPKIDEEIIKEIEEDEVVIEKLKTPRVLDIEDKPIKPSKKPVKQKSGIKILISFIVLFVCIALIALALSLLYTKGVVTVTPIVKNLNVDGTLTVKKDAPADQLKYEIVTISDESSKSVIAADGPLVQTKAKGTVTLYNNTSTAQKIIAGTRLSNSEDLIFRTTTTVTIPAKKTSPGSISVGVIADQAGANYNTSLTDLTGDFKIVAYKGTSKYTSIYGRIKTEIIGGFSGVKKIISSETQKSAEQELQAELKANLLAQIIPIVPKDYVLFDNAYIIDYQVLEATSSPSGNANITMRGTINGIIFNSDTLLKTIATKNLKTFPAEQYDTKGLQDLKFSISNIKDFSVKKGTPLTFTLNGPVTLIGTFSEERLKKDLINVSLKNSTAVFRSYNAISNAYAVITPFWIRAFPNSIEHIKIEYKSQ